MRQIKRWINKMWIVPGVLLVAAGCNQGTQSGNDPGINNIEPAPAAVTEPNTPAAAYVRAVHTVRGAGPVTVTIDGQPAIADLAFGRASDFIGVHGEKVKIHSTQDHQITVVDAAGKTIGGPLPVDLERGEDFTVVIGGTPGKLTLTPFEHTNRGPDNENAKLAVLHADRTLPEVAIAIDSKNWTGDIGYGEVTGYRVVAPGRHTLSVMYDKTLVGILDLDRKPGISPPPPVGVRATNLIALKQPMELEAGKVYSVILHADANGRPKLYFLEDKFVPALIRQPDIGTPTNADGTDSTVGNMADGTAANGDTTNGNAEAPVTDLLVVVARPVKPELIGRRVQLTDVQVQSVVGDEVFWVGSDKNQRLLVSWDEEKGTEARTDVNAGQKVTLSGVLRKAPTTAQAQQQWGLTAAEAGALKDRSTCKPTACRLRRGSWLLTCPKLAFQKGTTARVL